MNIPLENPEAFVSDVFVIVAMKEAVASFAGHGMDAGDVRSLNLSIAPVSGGRLLREWRSLTTQHLLVVSYTFRVPESISSNISFSLGNQTSAAAMSLVRSKLSVVGWG